MNSFGRPSLTDSVADVAGDRGTAAALVGGRPDVAVPVAANGEHVMALGEPQHARPDRSRRGRCRRSGRPTSRPSGSSQSDCTDAVASRQVSSGGAPASAGVTVERREPAVLVEAQALGGADPDAVPPVAIDRIDLGMARPSLTL